MLTPDQYKAIQRLNRNTEKLFRAIEEAKQIISQSKQRWLTPSQIRELFPRGFSNTNLKKLRIAGKFHKEEVKETPRGFMYLYSAIERIAA